jgi:hypothetical protein
MKRHLLILSVMTLFLTAASALAQSVNLKANVPFDFIVNGRTLPSGTYAIRSLQTGSSVAVQVQNVDSKESLIALPSRTQARTIPSESKLVFHRYGQTYFLSQVFMEGEVAGRELPKSHWETELAKNDSSEDVKLAANLK